MGWNTCLPQYQHQHPLPSHLFTPHRRRRDVRSTTLPLPHTQALARAPHGSRWQSLLSLPSFSPRSSPSVPLQIVRDTRSTTTTTATTASQMLCLRGV